MHYHKFKVGRSIIEFHNSWLGEETVAVNGRVVSKKGSVWGTSHYFTVYENGRQSRYTLVSKVTPQMQIVIDLVRNGRLLYGNIPLGTAGGRPTKKINKAKKNGLAKLREYHIKEALAEFVDANQQDPQDPEIYFHMACCYSNLEKSEEGYECLKKAIKYGFKDENQILTHDMLAFLRIQDAFEDFVNSGYKTFDTSKMLSEEE